jgi:two-component system sensor histidine kinase RegB
MIDPAPRTSDVEQINFSWLLRLRWAAIAGQVFTVLCVDRLMHIRLPLAPLGVIIGLEVATNVAYEVKLRRRLPVRAWERPAIMALDVLVLTGLLYFTGGPFNPFSFLYLVEIALGAIVLRARWIWTLVLLSLVCFGLLFLEHRPLPLELDAHAGHAGSASSISIHLYGMWVAFGVAAGFIVYFLLRITRALATREAELEEARQRVQRSQRLASLATLAAGAAHELATPLSTIALVAKELEHRLASSPVEHGDVRLIRDQVQRCRRILDQMAVEAGESAGEGLAPLPVAELLNEARRDLAATPVVRIRYRDDAARAVLEVPPHATAQALRALIKNAQEASAPEADIAIEVIVDEGALRIEIRDRGAGMQPDVLSRVCEPFFTTKAPGAGMGLGLFLSRTLLERLGGALELFSTPGLGTTVAARIPLAPRATIHHIDPQVGNARA